MAPYPLRKLPLSWRRKRTYLRRPYRASHQHLERMYGLLGGSVGRAVQNVLRAERFSQCNAMRAWVRMKEPFRLWTSAIKTGAVVGVAFVCKQPNVTTSAQQSISSFLQARPVTGMKHSVPFPFLGENHLCKSADTTWHLESRCSAQSRNALDIKLPAFFLLLGSHNFFSLVVLFRGPKIFHKRLIFPLRCLSLLLTWKISPWIGSDQDVPPQHQSSFNH